MDQLDGELLELVETVRAWVDDAERVTALTGAGVSTDSGIPDFRGPNGVWTRNPEAQRLSDISYYLNDGEVRRRAWQGRANRPPSTREPNPGHYAFVTLERRGKLHALVTQNIDGLHQRAGLDRSRLVEAHGTSQEVECLGCGDRMPTEPVLERVRAGDDDPACARCGGILKTAVVSFGQSLREQDLLRAEQAALTCDLLLAVGTTLTVGPINGMVPLAKRSGARIVIVNAEETAYDFLADAVLNGPISTILPAIVGSAAGEQ